VPVDVFMSKYGCLLQRSDNELELRDQVCNILNVLLLPETEWQVGKTKVGGGLQLISSAFSNIKILLLDLKFNI
jgi:hypothetical protein